jgi:CheY-like chemotaxis protein
MILNESNKNRNFLLQELNFNQASLLVVEDQDDTWEIMNFILSTVFPDILIHRTKSRKETVAYINKAKATPNGLPKLILQDLNLPERENGFSLLNDLRVLLGYEQQIPILILSASSEENDVRKAYQGGASYYLIKPDSLLDWRRLFQSVRQFWWECGILPIY